SRRRARSAGVIGDPRASLLLTLVLGLGLGLQLLHLRQRLVGVGQGLLLAPLAADEHRLALDHQLDRRPHRPEPLVGVDDAPLLGLDQRPVLGAELRPLRRRLRVDRGRGLVLGGGRRLGLRRGRRRGGHAAADDGGNGGGQAGGDGGGEPAVHANSSRGGTGNGTHFFRYSSGSLISSGRSLARATNSSMHGTQQNS